MDQVFLQQDGTCHYHEDDDSTLYYKYIPMTAHVTKAFICEAPYDEPERILTEGIGSSELSD